MSTPINKSLDFNRFYLADVKHNSPLLIPRSTSPATPKPILISVHVADNDYAAACAIVRPRHCCLRRRRCLLLC
ncbi:hypothetical protein L1887_15486 [Cichorium endivia]|nr:hypothetical protein L1887_15486 [Cichorium endivia]